VRHILGPGVTVTRLALLRGALLPGLALLDLHHLHGRDLVLAQSEFSVVTMLAADSGKWNVV